MKEQHPSPTCLYVVFALLLLFLSGEPAQAKIICDVETFVRVEFLYQNCLIKTMQILTDHFEDPCPLLQKGVKSCIGLTKQCYDERGWQRVVQSNIDKTVLVYEEDKKKNSMGFCHLLNASIVDDPNFVFEGIPQKLPNELCTIPEEAFLVEGVDRCVNEELNHLLNHWVGDSLICTELERVYNKCAVDKLQTCFDAHDIVYQEMNVLESIKVAGTVIAEELIKPNSNKTIEEASANIAKCSVFTEHNLKRMSRDVSMYIWIYIGFALLALIIVLLVVGIFAVRLRMSERLRAIIHKKPYEEFAIPETTTRASEFPRQNV